VPFKTVLVKGLGKIKFPGTMSDDAIESSIKNLDMSEAARMARAKEQGFDASKTFYHGTGSDFDEFDLSMYGKNFTGDYGEGVYLTQIYDLAEKYAKAAGGDSQVLKGMLRLKNPVYVKKAFGDGDLWAMVPGAKTRKELTDGLKKLGHDGVMVMDRGVVREAVVFDPKNIRSTNAAFNPDAIDSPSLLASAAPAAIGLGALGGNDANASVTGSIQGPAPGREKIATVSEFIDRHDDIVFDDLLGGVTSWLDKVAYDDKRNFVDRLMAALDLI